MPCAREKRGERAYHIRSCDRSGSGDGHRMVVSGSSFCRQQIVVVSNMVQMRTFCHPQTAPAEDDLFLTRQLPFFAGILL